MRRYYCLPCPKRVDVILHLEFRFVFFVFFCLSPPTVRRPTLIPVLTRCQNNANVRESNDITRIFARFIYTFILHAEMTQGKYFRRLLLVPPGRCVALTDIFRDRMKTGKTRFFTPRLFVLFPRNCRRAEKTPLEHGQSGDERRRERFRKPCFFFGI